MSTSTVNIPYDNTSYLLLDNFNRTDSDVDGDSPTYVKNSATWEKSAAAVAGQLYECEPNFMTRTASASATNAIIAIDTADPVRKFSSNIVIGVTSLKLEVLFRLTGAYDYDNAAASFLSIGVRENGGNLQARAAMRTLGDTLSSITMDGGTDSWNTIGTVTTGATAEARIYIEDNVQSGTCTLKILDIDGTWSITSPVCTWSSVPDTHSTNTYFGLLISKNHATIDSKFSNVKAW